MATRPSDSEISGSLESERLGTAGGAYDEVGTGRLSVDVDDVGRPPWARRRTADGEPSARSGMGVALSWTDGAGGGRGGRASGKSRRGSSPASCQGAGATLGIDIVGSLTPDERSIGAGPTRGRSFATRCATKSVDTRSPGDASIGAGVTGERSIESRLPVEASIGSLGLSGRAASGSSARCTLWSGTCLIGAPRPIRRDWPNVSRGAGAVTGAASDSSSLGGDMVSGIGTALDRCATGGSGVGSALGGRLVRR